MSEANSPASKTSGVHRLVRWMKNEVETSMGAFCVIAYCALIVIAVCIMRFATAT